MALSLMLVNRLARGPAHRDEEGCVRKTRQRKIKALVEQQLGRKVNRKPVIVSSMGTDIGYIPSEWRRLKKATRTVDLG